MKLTLYIDADNVGGDKIAGVDIMRPDDKVIVFNNAAVRWSQKNIIKFEEQCKCEFQYRVVPMSCKNAVDFALAMELGGEETVEGVGIVVSGDQDLRHVVDIYKAFHPKSKTTFMVAPTVKSALLKAAPFCVNNENELRALYEAIYGSEFANIAIDNLKHIFSHKEDLVEPEKKIEPEKYKSIKPLFSLENLVKGR